MAVRTEELSMAQEINQIKTRIDGMAKWAAKMEAALRPQMPDTETLESESKQLYEQYKDVGSQLNQAVSELLGLQEPQSAIKTTLAGMEDAAFFEAACEINDKGKPLYSNDSLRKAAGKKILIENDLYIELSRNFQLAENKIARQKAMVTHYESTIKEFGRRNMMYVAQLNLAAAKLNCLKETK